MAPEYLQQMMFKLLILTSQVLYNHVPIFLSSSIFVHKSGDPVTLNKSLSPELSHIFILPCLCRCYFLCLKHHSHCPLPSELLLVLLKAHLYKISGLPSSAAFFFCVPIAVYVYNSLSCHGSHCTGTAGYPHQPVSSRRAEALTYTALCQQLLIGEGLA